MLAGPKARGLWFMFGSLCVLAGMVTAARAATRPPAYQPNTTAEIHRIIRLLDQLSAFKVESPTDSQGRKWRCRQVDDAPTITSLDRTAGVYYCVRMPVKPRS